MHENYREIPSPLQALWDVLENRAHATPSALRMSLRTGAFVAITAILIGPYALAGVTVRRFKRPIAKAWFAACATICGLDIQVRGRISDARQTLYAVNHVSYLDIVVLGLLMDAKFVAKGDVADWPLFGLLAKMSDTVFVTRERCRAGRDCKQICERIAGGERLILFPEGTSSNGRAVLPFRSALFGAVDPSKAAPGTTVQPVTIAYADYADGRPLTGHLTDLYAWYGDMTLFGHLMKVFGLKGARVEVTCHAPLKPVAFPDRKTLAATAERAVRAGLNDSLGR